MIMATAIIRIFTMFVTEKGIQRRDQRRMIRLKKSLLKNCPRTMVKVIHLLVEAFPRPQEHSVQQENLHDQLQNLLHLLRSLQNLLHLHSNKCDENDSNNILLDDN